MYTIFKTEVAMARTLAVFSLFLTLFSCEGIKVPEKDGSGKDEQFEDIGEAKEEFDLAKCPDGFFAIDDPCQKEIVCTDERNFKKYKTTWCYEIYDPDCCSGGQCDYEGAYECPEGSLCVKMGPGKNDECQKQEQKCGGIIGTPCPEGFFCEFPPGTCNIMDNQGDCVEIPENCPIDTTDCQPVCGCDNFTYCNDCRRRQELASKDYDGFCCDHTKINFTQQNKYNLT